MQVNKQQTLFPKLWPRFRTGIQVAFQHKQKQASTTSNNNHNTEQNGETKKSKQRKNSNWEQETQQCKDVSSAVDQSHRLELIDQPLE